jgi:hypothetical protein
MRLTEDQLRSLFVASLVVLGGRSFFAAIANASRLVRAFVRARKGGGAGGAGGPPPLPPPSKSPSPPPPPVV